MIIRVRDTLSLSAMLRAETAAPARRTVRSAGTSGTTAQE
jgi:hypothetical protein